MHLASESSANDLLTEAKLLRDSDDPHIAANVFINRDLSQAEAKLAFEQRQRRRAVQQRNAQRTQEHVDNSVGASINSVAGLQETQMHITFEKNPHNKIRQIPALMDWTHLHKLRIIPFVPHNTSRSCLCCVFNALSIVNKLCELHYVLYSENYDY